MSLAAADDHLCHCGKYGVFGHGGSTRDDRPYAWFCRDHNPQKLEYKTTPPLIGVTDADRRMALEQSRKRNSFHQERGDRDNKMAANLDGDEVVRRGLLGECAFANRFGNSVDYSLRAGGDGGRDFTLKLRSNAGVETFTVDVKTSTVRTVWAAVRNTTWLRVACDRIKPRTIYVGAIYLELEDDAHALTWEWGSRLIAFDKCQTFDNDVLSYTKPFKDCRDLAELEARLSEVAK